MSRILLLGGTGTIGGHMAQLLSDRGIEVHVTTRKKKMLSGSINYIVGDAKDDDFLTSILYSQWDAIVDFMVYDTAAFERRHDQLLGSTSQYFFTSSARVYSNSESPICEDTPRLLDSATDSAFLATDEYSLSKARQENILRSASKKNWTIIRPYITYGEQRLQLGVLEKEEWLYRALKGRKIVFLDDMVNKLTTLTYGKDVAMAIAALIGEPGAIGEEFHITQDVPASWQEVLNIYLGVLERHLGRRPEIILVGMPDFMTFKKGKYQIIYDRMFNRTFNIEKMSRHVRAGEFSAFEKSLIYCLNEFLKHPQFHSVDWRGEAIRDRLSGDFTPIGEIKEWKNKVKYLAIRYLGIEEFLGK